MMVRMASAALAALLMCGPVAAQSTLDVDKKRDEDLRELGSGIPDSGKLREIAKAMFARPVGDQKEEELKMVAEQANRYANMVGYISQVYDSYYRENIR